jgi:succinoglycan biosynthesis protein ExoA
VVLPILNESRDIGRLLGELLEQESVPGGFEVLVADGGSTDDTRAIVGRIRDRTAHSGAGAPPIRLLDNPRRLSSAGRNVGAAAATGEFVLFLDGHCALSRNDYLRRLVEIFEQTGADCLSRPQFLNQLKAGAWATAIANARHSWLGHSPGSDIYGCKPGETDPRSAGAAYRRERWAELGGYDERFDACEDVEFNHRIAEAGLLSHGHPDLVVYYRPRGSVRGLYRQMFRYGRGRARLMGKHPGMVPWPLVALNLAFVGVLGMSLAGYVTLGLGLLGVGITLWLTAALVEAIRVSPWNLVLRTMTAFGAIYAGLLLGFWRGLLEVPRFRGPGGPVTSGTEI